MLSFTLFLVAFSGLLISKKVLGDFFSPPAIYNFFWAFGLGSLELGWVDFDPLRSQVWLVIGIGYLGFMGGALIPGVYGAYRNAWLNARPAFQYMDRHRFEKALLVLFLLGVFGFLVQLVHLQMSLGLGSFLTDPQLAREEHSNVKYIGLLNVLNVANFVMALMYLLLFKRPRKWVVFIMLWALATTFVTTDRTRFFYMVIWSFYIGVFIFRRLNLTPRFILALGATFLALFGFFVLVAKMYKKEAFEDNMEYVDIPKAYSAVVDPYIYLTGSYPVLQAFLDDHTTPTYGKASLGPVVKVIELFYPELERIDIVGKFYRVPIELNACTWLEPFYKDFGMIGVAVGPFVIGLICMWSYMVMRARKTVFTVYFTSLLCFCTTISAFVNHFTQLATWYFILVGYLVYRYCHTSEAQPEDGFREKIFNL